MIDKKLAILGSSFRGLWRSVEISNDGFTSEKWAVTFEYELKMVETPYFTDPHEALDFAIKIKEREENCV